MTVLTGAVSEGARRGTASGYRVSVSGRGVFVRQSRRKTTGLRPDFGALQLREALEPALERNESQVFREVERAIDRTIDRTLRKDRL